LEEVVLGVVSLIFGISTAYERPMANANIKAPTGGVEKTVDEFGLGLLTVAGVGIAIHATASILAGKKESEKEQEEKTEEVKG